MGDISIKVSVRCRPFTIDDKLGVKLRQMSEEEGEVELINCDYTTTRFPFTYCWWTGFGYQRHLKGDNMEDADNMELIDQVKAYEQCGKKIKKDLMGGNAVVLFAYGLSGSGKTYTVFGPDAVDAPEAWFKWATPHALWGILPRLAYEIFAEKKDGWKVSMKYFQNVVDIVRDLMSPNGEERSYKDGMRKDPDGFMDIEWCLSTVVHDWDSFRKTFQVANGRKAIAPTQFNPMSTRGHCIMVLELEIPGEIEGTKLRGRTYICDLAGTEPAGDIVFAQYTKETFDDGSFEYKFTGPHPDMKKTKELQEQGKKINLSLSEMAQFFMKMAEAVKAKKLKPGMTIPGCNTFFLCKYLKDTMLQARTYLFCAIRPEKTYLKYTFATLGFAKNASVLKLSPKKATVACSAAERKLMAELDAMKALVESLKNAGGGGGGGGGGGDDDSAKMIAELQAKLAAKQDDLSGAMDGGISADQTAQIEQQRAEYGRKGISMVAYDYETNERPYFSNLDEDNFRSNRFMYILTKDSTIFGSKCDIQLPSMSVVKNHCIVSVNGDAVTLKPEKGDVYRNGKLLPPKTEVTLAIFDRVAMGDQLMLFRWPGKEDSLEASMSGEDAVEEYQNGMLAARASGGNGGGGLDEERARLEEEKARWAKDKEGITSSRNEADYQRAMTSVDNQILDLLPKTKEAKNLVDLLNRVTMTFDVVLEKGPDQIPRVKISVENTSPKLSILIDPQEFLPKLSLLKDEMMKLRSAIDASREYECPERHDPLYLMFDMDFHLGTATHFPEYLGYNLNTDEEEAMQDLKNAAVPYNNVGLLEVRWTPQADPDDENSTKPVVDVDAPSELIGKPWTYLLQIKRAADLPVFCEMAYVSYEFFGETYTTEAVQQADGGGTYSPVFDYKRVHHVPSVTQEFLDYLMGHVEMQIHITQHINDPPDRIGTSNAIVKESIISGEAKGYEVAGAAKPKSEAEVRCEQLTVSLAKASEENQRLKAKIAELELKIIELASPRSKMGADIEAAKILDGAVND